MKDTQTTGIDKLTASLLSGHSFKLVDKEGETTFTITGIMDDTFYLVDEESTPHYFRFDEAGVEFFVLCRPLTDLTKEIEFEEDVFIPINRLWQRSRDDYEYDKENCSMHMWAYEDIDKLLQWHFKPSSLPDECCRFIEG